MQVLFLPTYASQPLPHEMAQARILDDMAIERFATQSDI